MTLGKRLRNLRQLKSQEMGIALYVKDVANAVDVSTSAMYMYERDERTPPADRLVALAAFYGVTVDYLLLGCSRGPGNMSESHTMRDLVLRDHLKAYGATDEDIQFIFDLLQRRRMVNGR